MSNTDLYLLAKVTKNSDWEVLKKHHQEKDVIFYSYNETIISELDLFKLGDTPINFSYRIGEVEYKYDEAIENESVGDDEIFEIENKIIKMKKLYNRLNLKQYINLDI